MKNKVIVFDLDGTLLGANNEIIGGTETLNCLDSLQQMGWTLAICTGRLDHDILKIEEQYKLKIEHRISQNGAVCMKGQQLIATLIDASGFEKVEGPVTLSPLDNGTYEINAQTFDKVILACGAWLGQTLELLGFDVDVRPQKGQLRDYFFEGMDTGRLPVLMPEGELDVIPFAGGKISVGASHENDQGFDLTVDETVLASLEEEAKTYFPDLSTAKSFSERVGTRAYTSDFSPFFGEVPELESVFVASGLGSSGLTTGPLIGKNLVDLAMNRPGSLDSADYPVAQYIKKKD